MHAERVAAGFSMLSSRPGFPLWGKKNQIYSYHLQLPQLQRPKVLEVFQILEIFWHFGGLLVTWSLLYFTLITLDCKVNAVEERNGKTVATAFERQRMVLSLSAGSRASSRRPD